MKANKRKSRVFGVDIWVNVVTCSTVYRIFRGITDLTFCFLVTVACRNPARIQPSVVMTNDNRTAGVFTFRTFKVLTPPVDYRVQHFLPYEIANFLFSSNERFSRSVFFISSYRISFSEFRVAGTMEIIASGKHVYVSLYRTKCSLLLLLEQLLNRCISMVTC